jgi:hypothetical protein
MTPAIKYSQCYYSSTQKCKKTRIHCKKYLSVYIKQENSENVACKIISIIADSQGTILKSWLQFLKAFAPHQNELCDFIKYFWDSLMYENKLREIM